MSARTDLPRVRQVRTRAASRPVSIVFFFIGNPFQNFVISIIYIYILSRFFMKFYLLFGVCLYTKKDLDFQVFSISSQKMRKITLALQFCDRVIFSCLFLFGLLY